MREQLDVVIPIRITNRFNNAGDLNLCVQSFLNTTKDWPTRFIFVDDNSDRDYQSCLDELTVRFPNSILIRTGFQRWWTRAVNIGLRMVRTERVLVLNSDVGFGDGWLEELYAVWEEAERISGRRVGLVGSEFNPHVPDRWQITHNPGYVTAHCILCSMPALAEVANARATPGWVLDEVQQVAIHIRSDNYLSYDLQKLHWQTVKSFKSGVGHVGGKSWGHALTEIGSIPLTQVNERWQ
jgi:glycosyltransferase involved in cell wall biosynthesis